MQSVEKIKKDPDGFMENLKDQVSTVQKSFDKDPSINLAKSFRIDRLTLKTLEN